MLHVGCKRRIRYGDGMDGDGQLILATPANHGETSGTYSEPCSVALIIKRFW
jgi:hypothetical protein